MTMMKTYIAIYILYSIHICIYKPDMLLKRHLTGCPGPSQWPLQIACMPQRHSV